MDKLVKKPKFKTAKKNLRRNLFLLSLLIVPFLHFLVFWVYINVRTISLAFTRYDFFENKYVFVGIENFIEQFKAFKERPETLNMFKNSFKAFPINVACLVLAIIIGYAFSKHIRGEKAFRIIFYLPTMISIVIQTLCFRYIFTYNPGMLEGPGSELLKFFGINWNGWETATSDPEVIRRVWTLIGFFCVWNSAGINIILMSSAMSRVPNEVIEASKLDGVGFWRELFEIQIPLIMPTISVFLINSVAAISAFYIQPMLLTANSPGPGSVYYTVGWYMFDMATTAQDYDLPDISTVGFIMTVVISTLLILTKIITDKLTPDVEY